MTAAPSEITVTVDGGTLPVVDLLTGRGFITGKSGSGKSVTASVIAEELLDHDLSFLIVDTDGEYYGLKEQYEVLHVGADDACDAQVGVEHAPLLAELALEEDVPVILDVSGYLDEDERTALLERVVRELFTKEKRVKKPFLLIVEEVHEYLPESGGLDEFGERLLQIAKRGRKRGLGLCGISQRPAAVDKDFITQCNWIVWHRLTWNNDTDVVRRIVDSDAATTVENLENGEALLMTDWDERVRRVRFRMRETVDVGTTPDFSDPTEPDLLPVDPSIVQRLDAVGTPSSAETDDREERADAATPANETGGSRSTNSGSTSADANSSTEHDRARASRSGNASVTVQRDNLLLELGDLMVYVFGVIRIRSTHVVTYLWRELRLALESAGRILANSTGDPADRDDAKLGYLLGVLLLIGVLGALYWIVF